MLHAWWHLPQPLPPLPLNRTGDAMHRPVTVWRMGNGMHRPVRRFDITHRPAAVGAMPCMRPVLVVGALHAPSSSTAGGSRAFIELEKLLPLLPYLFPGNAPRT